MSLPDVISRYAATPKTRFSRKPANTPRPRTTCKTCRQKFSPKLAPQSTTKASPQRKQPRKQQNRSSMENVLRGGSKRVAIRKREGAPCSFFEGGAFLSCVLPRSPTVPPGRCHLVDNRVGLIPPQSTRWDAICLSSSLCVFSLNHLRSDWIVSINWHSDCDSKGRNAIRAGTKKWTRAT